MHGFRDKMVIFRVWVGPTEGWLVGTDEDGLKEDKVGLMKRHCRTGSKRTGHLIQ
jgi:hypothetical protein